MLHVKVTISISPKLFDRYYWDSCHVMQLVNQVKDSGRTFGFLKLGFCHMKLPRCINVSRWTPLHLASVNGHNAVVETLLEKGGEVNAKTMYGRTAMHLAAWKGHTAVLEVLREGGADVDAADGEGDTPLNTAASLGHLLAIFMLMNFGASTYKKDNCGRTPQDLMPRSFSTESCGMELFQSASMTHVAQGWSLQPRRKGSVCKEKSKCLRSRGREISAKSSETVNLQKETRDLKEDLREGKEIVLLKALAPF
ncbi:CARD- and ANK-domain containing inflammasome adapter protein-like [Penaeus japonicus]|uniref:CARD- and ANK-domain containing inflammasome adapter protein-like n=1 Tax=Penaeus japonicus TaxID=27405 RepID=UPI001C71249C|nr:CARD- and ANK-domain containing inflammasome adapter protein-like [Penaeus japonicus]